MKNLNIKPGKPHQLFDKGLNSTHEAPRPNADGFFGEDDSPIEPISIWRIYYSRAGRARALTYFLKAGYLYFVLWRNNGYYGMQAAWRMRGQEDGDPPYIIR